MCYMYLVQERQDEVGGNDTLSKVQLGGVRRTISNGVLSLTLAISTVEC